MLQEEIEEHSPTVALTRVSWSIIKIPYKTKNIFVIFIIKTINY